MWQLPVVAMLGYAGTAMFAYSSGVFLIPLTEQFDWSRAEFSFGFTLQMVIALVAMPLVGRLVDHVGPRRVALAGIVPFAIGFALLGLVGNSIWSWWALCSLMAICAAFIAPAVWMTAVVERFDVSRGLALAVALAGVGVATTIWPVLAALYIEHLGWRSAFPALSVTWGLVLLPLVLCYFHGARNRQQSAKGNAPSRTVSGYWETLRSRTFLSLVVAGGLFASLSFGLTLHLVPILTNAGLELTPAAAIASVMGISAIAGRIGTGYLLDHMPLRPLGAIVFLLPVLVIFLFLGGGNSIAVLMLAAAILGLATGAEIDIITYIVSRRFPQELFASIYAVIMAVFGVSASAGPLIAGTIFDVRGSYDLYFLLVVAMALTGLLFFWLATSSPATKTKIVNQ